MAAVYSHCRRPRPDQSFANPVSNAGHGLYPHRSAEATPRNSALRASVVRRLPAFPLRLDEVAEASEQPEAPPLLGDMGRRCIASGASRSHSPCSST